MFYPPPRTSPANDKGNNRKEVYPECKNSPRPSNASAGDDYDVAEKTIRELMEVTDGAAKGPGYGAGFAPAGGLGLGLG